MKTRQTANFWVLGFSENKPNGIIHAFHTYEDAMYFTALNNGANNIAFAVTYNFSDMINYCGVCDLNAKKFMFQYQ
jgi:hypothetical protein